MAPYEQYHVFSIPQTLLDTLVPRNIASQSTALNEQSRPTSPAPPTTTAAYTSGARACNICMGTVFVDVDEQRIHFRSDWHRYNVKMRMGGGNVVTEAQFSQLVDGLEDSLSGSASESEGSDESEDDAVSALVHKTRRLNTKTNGAEDDDDDTSRNLPNMPVIWFHSPPVTQLGTYKALFPSELISSRSDNVGQLFLDELKAMQKGGGEEGKKWALFMVAGGHFAGAVVRVSRPEGEEDEGGVTKKGKLRKPKPDNEVLMHKTFHRYTTRRKQGGSQSTNDNSKSKAVSAGAMLRRYGEQALREDIRKLLTDWAEDLYDCERIFIRASVSNRRIFFDYEGAVIEKGDDRLRTFPFPTRRPTQAELTRCLQELTRVKISHLTEDALHEQDEAYLASLPKPKVAPPTAPIQPQRKLAKQLSPEEIAIINARREIEGRWSRALEMVAKGRLDPLKVFLAKEGVLLGDGAANARIPEDIDDAMKGETLLVYATRKSQEDIVRWLIEDARVDPTVDVYRASADGVDDPVEAHEDDDEAARPVVGGSRRTAYDFARTRAVRNIFRRCAADHSDWWDWLGTGDGGARVPSVLSKEMEEGREEKKKVRRKGLKDKVREREALQKDKEKELPVVVEEPKPEPRRPVKEPDDGPRKLGGASGAGESVMGLTPEMRAKVERERRARAAEARMKALGGSR